MRIVILGMHLQPLHGALALVFREPHGVGVLGADHRRPFPGRPFDGVVGRCHGDRQRLGAAHPPAPVVEPVELRRHVLALQFVQVDAMGLTPVQPVVGMVELDADVAHQPAPRHVFTGVAGVAGLGQVVGHVQRELLDHRPATDQVLANGRLAQLAVAQALIELMLDHPALALPAVLDQLLSPLGVTGRVHQRPDTNECINHFQLLDPCDLPIEVQRKVPGARCSRGRAAIRWRCRLSPVNTCGLSIR
ncbi:hypothetical protein PSPL106493_07845 [Pseudomonas plecoglossicida]